MMRDSILFNRIRQTLGEVASETDDPMHKAKLSAVDRLVTELMVRSDEAFYRGHASAGCKLAVEGRELLGESARSEKAAASTREEVAGIGAGEPRLSAVRAELVRLAEAMKAGSSAGQRDFLARLCAWDVAFFAHSFRNENVQAAKEADRFTRSALESYLQEKWPDAEGLRITGLHPLLGGFSKRTILIDMEDKVYGARSVVLRAEQTAALLRFSIVTAEYWTICYLRSEGLPVAEPLLLESDAAHFGVPFLISARAPGGNFGVTVGGRDTISPQLLDSFLAAFCKMHTLRPDGSNSLVAASPLAEWLPCENAASATQYYVTTYLDRIVADSGIPSTPLLTYALSWLRANIPASDQPSVILHLDFGLNNVLIDGERVSLILDLESVIMGHPALDIIKTQEAVADVISMDEFLNAYRDRTGYIVTQWQIAYARVARSVLYLIIFLNARKLLEEGRQAPDALGLLAYRYLGKLASEIAPLIAAAEACRQSGDAVGQGSQ